MTDEPPPKPRSKRLYISWGIAIGLVLLAGVLGSVFGADIRAHYYHARCDAAGHDTYGWPPFARKMVESGPTGVRLFLQDTREGSYDGDIEQIVGLMFRKYARCDVYPYLSPLFTDPDARVRGFAALAAGYTSDERYLEPLQELANDTTALPSTWFTKTVAERAKHGIGLIERSNAPDSQETWAEWSKMIDELTVAK